MGGVASKIVELMKRVEYLHKGGKNDYHGYTYLREEDILDAVRSHMAELGLALLPTSIDSLDVRGGLVTAVVTYTLVDAESGETMPIRVVAQGADSQDKGAYKLMTGARKYAVRQLILAASGDDPERDDDSLDRMCKHSRTPILLRKMMELGIIGVNVKGDPVLSELEDVLGISLFDVVDVDLLRRIYKCAVDSKGDPSKFIDCVKEVVRE